MNTVVSVSVIRCALIALGICVAAVSTVGCSDTVQATSACANIDEKNMTRDGFLPCASELIAALNEIAPLSHAAIKGSRQARLDGEAELRQILPILNEAGGERLLERSDDRDLSDLRAEIHNAIARYSSYFALAIPPDHHPMARRARQEAQWELDRAARHHDSARNLYRELAQ